jgi:hypothetical protein
MVNKWARNLYLGKIDAETIVVMEDASNRLIGLCSFLPDSLPLRPGKLLGQAQRINMLATDRLYHGMKLEDGSRPGDVLLHGALEQIQIACGGSMPYVWALVSPENHRSRALFGRHGFRELPYKGEGEVVHVRARHKRLPVLTPQSTSKGIARRFARRT